MQNRNITFFGDEKKYKIELNFVDDVRFCPEKIRTMPCSPQFVESHHRINHPLLLIGEDDDCRLWRYNGQYWGFTPLVLDTQLLSSLQEQFAHKTSVYLNCDANSTLVSALKPYHRFAATYPHPDKTKRPHRNASGESSLINWDDVGKEPVYPVNIYRTAFNYK